MTRAIAQILNISQRAIVNYLHKLGYTTHLNVWVPYTLSEKNLMDRISICDFLLKRNKNEPLLRRIVTGVKK